MREEDNPGKDKPKKGIKGTIIRASLAGFGLIALLNTPYVVDQREHVVVTQWGEPKTVVFNPSKMVSEERQAEIKESYRKAGIHVTEGPGLRFKIPFIQSVKRFSNQVRRWDGYPEEIVTKDKKYIYTDTSARWYSEDPLLYLTSVGTTQNAMGRLDELIDSATRNILTNRDLIEIVRTDNREMQVSEMELKETTYVAPITEGRNRIVEAIAEESRESLASLGIGLADNHILVKGLTYVEAVKKAVEGRMISERTRIATRYISEGEGEYERIVGNKERQVKTTISEAQKKAEIIRGQADSLATVIYARGFVEDGVRYFGYDTDPQFYNYAEALNLLRNLPEGTRANMGLESQLIQLMKGYIPPNEFGKQNK